VGIPGNSRELPGSNISLPGSEAEAALDAVVEEDILAYSLVHGGKIIAEYYRDGRDASDTAAIWSVTKSWTSLLIGTLVKDGRLTRQTSAPISLVSSVNRIRERVAY
jgi:CubicO group peptidase (beta-lactamase class C family)